MINDPNIKKFFDLFEQQYQIELLTKYFRYIKTEFPQSFYRTLALSSCVIDFNDPNVCLFLNDLNLSDEEAVKLESELRKLEAASGIQELDTKPEPKPTADALFTLAFEQLLIEHPRWQPRDAENHLVRKIRKAFSKAKSKSYTEQQLQQAISLYLQVKAKGIKNREGKAGKPNVTPKLFHYKILVPVFGDELPEDIEKFKEEVRRTANRQKRNAAGD